ncbi:carboxymuconolactone decarboxylase family protein [Microbacterium esteraromaticum]|uniref:carboxymuconolactone decarboxylase family protein n=1 Tax=Microbacterium esteraromaticum TaxID=57043 RepID=UPI001C973EB4|nr:carboxymuconolactone decarboxylase family protein [Microbacterium esteraromaticum]MBY6062401.1 carboxymuconolactone decarboxylase family protein [Microbacterium esteraromaticum]
MSESPLPARTPALNRRRRELVPESTAAFDAFSAQVFSAGALDEKTKQLIAIAVGHITQCPYCIDSHTKQAAQKGASEEEIMEAVWVAAQMNAGAAFAHSVVAMNALKKDQVPG